MSNPVDPNVAEQIYWPNVELTTLRNSMERLQHNLAKLQDTYEELHGAPEGLQDAVERLLDCLEQAIDELKAFEDACGAAVLTGEGAAIEVWMGFLDWKIKSTEELKRAVQEAMDRIDDYLHIRDLPAFSVPRVGFRSGDLLRLFLEIILFMVIKWLIIVLTSV